MIWFFFIVKTNNLTRKWFFSKTEFSPLSVIPSNPTYRTNNNTSELERVCFMTGEVWWIGGIRWVIKTGRWWHRGGTNAAIVFTKIFFSDSYGLVTSVAELKYIQPLPVNISTANDVPTNLGRCKYMIQTDLESPYLQLQMDRDSKKWLCTNSP